MILPSDPRRLAVDLLPRSRCAVQVAAVIADSFGIFSWGHNHMGFDGLGMHAEHDAIRRANKRRLLHSTIFVAARRHGSITSRPCEACLKRLRGWKVRWMVWRDKDGKWVTELLA